MSLVLRPYQQEAVDSVFNWWATRQGFPLVVLPTGTGKSLVLAELAKRCLEYPDTKILVVAHVMELIKQNFEEMITLWPQAPAGINSAGVGRRDYHSGVIFCSIQTVWNKAHLFDKVDIVLIDEAHLIPPKDTTMYRQFFKTIQTVNPHSQIVGLTATPFRLDGGYLHKDADGIFDDICYDYNVSTAIDEGYLCPPTARLTEAHLDTTGVKLVAGEFNAGQLEAKVNVDPMNQAVVAETLDWARKEGRKSILLFTSGVKHAEAICEVVRAHGVSCETIHAKTPKEDRKRILEAFKAGKITALASMNVLTTGFNAKGVDLIALLRPTKSAGLYVQMVGRGTRPLYAPGMPQDTGAQRVASIAAGPKPNCRILDFAGNIARFGPIDAVRVKEPTKGEGEAPFKICPECQEINHAAAQECKVCHFLFPPREIKVAPKPSDLAILSREIPKPPEWVAVDEVTYKEHTKADKPNSMRVIYQCGLLQHSTYVCVAHGGYAQERAQSWWVNNGGQKPVPRTAAEALARSGELTVPAEIRVRQNGQYTEVVATRGVSSVPVKVRPVVGVETTTNHVGLTAFDYDDIPF